MFDPAIIQELLVCAPTKLQRIAEKYGMAASRASMIRNHWIRRITNHCVHCNAIVRGDSCTRCTASRQSAAELLQKIHPKQVALRRYCTHCGVPFYYTAGYLLSAFKKGKNFRPSVACEKCRKAGAPPKRKKKSTRRKAAAPIPAPTKAPIKRRPNKEAGLTHQPFAELGAIQLKMMKN